MLYDLHGNRKYLTARERHAFISAAHQFSPEVETFCLTLAYTGARISEVLSLTPARIDLDLRCIIIESLKKRRMGIFRSVPVPETLLTRLNNVHKLTFTSETPRRSDQRLWPWCRTTAWSTVKNVMRRAGIYGAYAMPKGLRHGFAVESVTEAVIPLNVVQRWLGHARIETTAIYANAVGKEERMLAQRLWAVRTA